MSIIAFEKKITLPKTMEEWRIRKEYLRSIVRDIFEENKIPYEENITFENGLFVDFYNKEHNLAVEVYDLASHCSSKDILDFKKISDKQPYNNWKKANDLGIRLICAYENEILDEKKYYVFRNMIQYQCGIFHRIYARNTKVEIIPALKMKPFYEANNIQGYRNAKTAFVLKDKKTNEPLMAYSIGNSFFGKGKYSCEIARGACVINYHNTGIGIQIVAGASKLWKHILEYGETHNPDGTPGKIDTIVYYTDSRYYDGRSIGHLMDSGIEGGRVETLATTPGFMNFWDNVPENPENRQGLMKNREASKHSFIMQGYRNGNILCIPNAGTTTHVYIRDGIEL